MPNKIIAPPTDINILPKTESALVLPSEACVTLPGL